MLPIPYKIIFIAAGAIVACGMVYYKGYQAASDKYAPEIAQLRAAINEADKQAKIQTVKNQEALNENRIVAKDLAGRIAAGADIDAARVRELQARNTALANAVAASTTGDVREACESGVAEQLAEIKYLELKGRCITDAAARVVIRDWAARIGLKPDS